MHFQIIKMEKIAKKIRNNPIIIIKYKTNNKMAENTNYSYK